jgi:hypothetical protein
MASGRSILRVAVLSAEKAAETMRLLLAALLAACFATAAIAQTTTANKPSQLKPKEPMGCKLVGTVKGTKLWAGDCVAASELRSAAPAETPSLPERASEAIPPDPNQ